jgi:hypothetical protein
MVAAALVATIAPGDAETRDHRARKGLVEMAAQYDRRDQELVRQGPRNIERNRIAVAALRLPGLPQRGVLLKHIVERLQQAADRQRRRGLGAAAKAE